MGAKDSKRLCLPYEDAIKRMSKDEYKRICEAFKRLSGGSHHLSRTNFIQHVLGDGVPPTIAEWLYLACGGTQRGILFKDLICGLVLLTKGNQDEKIRFLFTLYCNDSGTHIIRSELNKALQVEGQPLDPFGLFAPNQDRISYEVWSKWIEINPDATILSKWLLSKPCVSLSAEMEAPTFYQTLAGVTHLEEWNICELEKCFWTLQAGSAVGQLDLACVRQMICPPVPYEACEGLFMALDVNGDGHVDFKELCCGISAACRGPTTERMKFCFKIFDMDRDSRLNRNELTDMKNTLLFVANENSYIEPEDDHFDKTLETLENHLDENGELSQEEFLVWATSTDQNELVEPMLELVFQVCHISFVLRPHCRHHEFDIVNGWLRREERRGYTIGQIWYLISNDWWQNWFQFTTSSRTNVDYCNCRRVSPPSIEEGIICDESLISNGTDSNSLESMGDVYSQKGGGGGGGGNTGDSCSIASSSGVSSSSGTLIGHKRQQLPGLIDNSSLVVKTAINRQQTSLMMSLTGEGGRLKKDTPLVQNRDFVLVPESLWRALAHWYGCQLPLPRQVIKAPGLQEPELELYPFCLTIYRHVNQTYLNNNNNNNSWSSMVGGYGAAALNTAGLTTTTSTTTTTTNSITTPKRQATHTATFSRLSNIKQLTDFLCARLGLRVEDVRLWHCKNGTTNYLDDDFSTLQELGFNDDDGILLEVRNKDLTWPEEMGALVAGTTTASSILLNERRPTICLPPGATGLHNLGNTCFMNAALQAVSNTRPLTQYFQRDGQLRELNSTNPHGTKGMVARRYAELCRELWAGSTRSVAPLKLRYCLTKHAPTLGSGGQHDSQELLAWLLDSLHEDLNRVASKQYIELKDSGGRPDEVVADEAWGLHLARDHSIITDLFYGQLKSKVTCMECKHESVRFDAFNLLSLPLPMESFTLCEILVVRLNGDTPIKYGLRLNSEAKYIELKQQLYELCDIKPERILLAELASSQIRQVLNDDSRISQMTATELFAYELPAIEKIDVLTETCDLDEFSVCNSPLARSPEVRGGSALCMPNILCFKNKTKSSVRGLSIIETPKIPSTIVQSESELNSSTLHQQTSNSNSMQSPNYLIAVHRKCVRQETYFLSQQKSKPSLFGVPLLLGFQNEITTCQSLYEAVFGQVSRLLSPLPQSDQTNHATDCDDSLRYEFPFILKAVLQGGQICAKCHWTQFCRGCTLPCDESLLIDHCFNNIVAMCIAIDWDPTALHLRYQGSREKLWSEDSSILKCRKIHTEPIDLDYCLRAFTSEERLEARYYCSNCQAKQPATKKLQIWRLPPILIIHLKRFDYCNNKWVKTQKAVNFPFKNFDPTAYLASVPQETILRHIQLKNEQTEGTEVVNNCEETIDENFEFDENDRSTNSTPTLLTNENSKLLKDDGGFIAHKKTITTNNTNQRKRLESTSLQKTPIIDEHLKDYHEHKLKPGQDLFDLKYQLYAVVSHSGMLSGGHYISYACNPNGNWYCYNDSSCREVMTEFETESTTKRTNEEEEIEQTIETGEKKFQDSFENKCAYSNVKTPKIDTSSAYILFYERSGLNYKPYLPDLMSNHAGVINNVPEVELDENESELRKQMCLIQ